MNEDKNILEILLDQDNDEDIALYDAEGECVMFEQVAVVPLDETLYAVLKPVDSMQMCMPDDAALVFRVDYDEVEEPYLVIETDEATAERVFEEYYRLLDEAEYEDIDEGNTENKI